MKTTTCVLLAILLALAAGRAAWAATWEPAGLNLLANPGFERGTADWTISGNKAAATVDQRTAHAGKQSLRLSATGQAGEVRVIAGAKVDPAKKYRVSFAAKADDIGRDPKVSNADFVLDMAAAVGLAAYGEGRWLDWCPTPEAVGLRGTSDWRIYSFDVTNLPLLEHVAATRSGVGFRHGGEVITVAVGKRRDVLRVGFDQPATVADHLLILETNAVTR